MCLNHSRQKTCKNYCIVRDSAQLKICILVSNQLIFGSCIVEAIEVVPNNKVSEF